MEEKALKLMAQLGLLALLIWVIAAALGKRNQATVKKTGKRRQDPKSNVWRQVPVQADSASSGLLWTPSVTV